jgi:hypothetical protein
MRAPPVIQAHGMFRRVRFKMLGIIIIVIDFIVVGSLFMNLSISTARWIHIGFLGIAIATAYRIIILDFKYREKYRKGVLSQLHPGWYSVGLEGWVKQVSIQDEQIEASGEQEFVSLCDQGGIAPKLYGVGDIFVYLLCAFMFVPSLTTSVVHYFDMQIGIGLLFLIILLKWIVAGNPFFAGHNRLQIDPARWEWGAWSQRYKKEMSWEDTRVVVKPMTKRGRDEYFVILGNKDKLIGMIVPKASVDLIKQSYVAFESST